jgi:hypothetical protein
VKENPDPFTKYAKVKKMDHSLKNKISRKGLGIPEFLIKGRFHFRITTYT